MPGPLATYAFVNAKIRTRISLLLSDDDYRRFEAASTFEELLDLLSGTPYREAAIAYRGTGDPNICELSLHGAEQDVYEDLLPHLSGAPAGIVSALYYRLEIENIKAALRIWFEREVRGIPNEQKNGYLPRRPWPRGVQGDRLIESDSLDALLNHLGEALGIRPSLPDAESVSAGGSLFRVEIELDRHYFDALSAAVGKLEGRDHQVAARLVGLQADIENIRRIARLSSFYDLPAELITRSLIDIPSSRIRAAKIGADLSLDEVVSDRFPEIGALLSGSQRSLLSRIDLVEEALEHEVEREVKRVLGGYPFTVGIVLSYCMLKEREISNIMSLLNQKRYSLISYEATT